MHNPPHPYPISDGPLDTRPRGYADESGCLAVLLAELTAAGVELGEYDRRIVDWLAVWDWPTVATIASLIRRAARSSQ
ncbi:hypothetical protein [Streptomyces macrosporus]|uniref:Uncharacterized protein n=1 Tax=Streptomyces macrosporus TaxID=44032 RepID=A0ABN3KQA9_9ACTN